MGKPLEDQKGSKDKKKRRKSGYLLKEAWKRQVIDQGNGQFNAIDEYLK